jgi:phage tail-like protein
LNPSVWSVTPIPPSAEDPRAWVTVEVLGVRPVRGDLTGCFFDLLLDLDPTFEITYTVEAQGISGAIDILRVQSPPQSQQAEAFDPSYRTLLRPLLRWFGSATSELDSQNRDNARTIAILDEVMNQVSSLIEGIQELFNPLTIPERWLDEWLVALGNPFRDLANNLSLTQKRRLAMALVGIYRRKGTSDGVEAAIAIFVGVEVVVHVHSRGGWVLNQSILGTPLGDPMDAEHPDASDGNCVLMSSPRWHHSCLAPAPHTQAIRLGQWLLRAGNEGRHFVDPILQQFFLGEPTPISEEREGYYTFAIVADRAISAQERAQIERVANYMKPASTRLVAVYDPY